jgi:hypothetical protein
MTVESYLCLHMVPYSFFIPLGGPAKTHNFFPEDIPRLIPFHPWFQLMVRLNHSSAFVMTGFAMLTLQSLYSPGSLSAASTSFMVLSSVLVLVFDALKEKCVFYTLLPCV